MSDVRWSARGRKQLWTMLLLAGLGCGNALAFTSSAATTVQHATATKKKTSGKSKKREKKQTSAGKSVAMHQAYVPVPIARPLPQQSEPQEGAEVPPPRDLSSEQPASYSRVTPQSASAVSVQQQLAHGKSALHFAQSLQSYFDALHAHESAPTTTTVRAVQFGDSHTAADMFSGEMRSQIQARFGNGGIGFSYAGHPFAGYRILGSGRSQSSGWQTLGTHFTQLGDGLLGMGGVAIEAQQAGSSISLDVNCASMEIQYLKHPGGGSFQFEENGQVLKTVATDAEIDSATASTGIDQEATEAGSVTASCAPGLNHFVATTVSGNPVRLLGTVSLQPGATWEAIGINGAEAPLILRWNEPIFHHYLSAEAPQLIVLAYGTNEAAARWTQDEYKETFGRLIDTLHRDVPSASILVLGPGDRSIASNSYVSSGTGAHARKRRRKGFTPYVGTARILNAQREVCSTHDCAFWDWSARQGGLGSMQRWVAAGYAQPDHTHFTGIGYRSLADALYADLLSSYEHYLKNGPS